jgi:hypothetical protein
MREIDGSGCGYLSQPSPARQVWPRSPPAVARVAALGCEVPANSQFRCSALLDHLRMLTLPA